MNLRLNATATAWVVPLVSALVCAVLLLLDEKRGLWLGLLPIGLWLSFEATLWRKKRLAWLTFLLVPLSVPVGTSTVLDLPSEGFAVLLVLGTLLTGRLQPRMWHMWKHPLTWLLAAEVGWLLVATFSSSMFAVSLKRVVIRALFLLVFFGMGYGFAQRDRSFWKLWLAYPATFALVVLYTIWQYSKFNFLPQASILVSRPFFPEHTLYGACLAFVVPTLILLYGFRHHFDWMKSRAFRWLQITTGIILLGVFLSFSRGAWLSLVVAGGFYALIRLGMNFRHLMIGLVVGAGLVVWQHEALHEKLQSVQAVSHQGQITDHLSSVGNIQSDDSNLERLNRWSSAWRMVRERPFFGFGPGTFQFLYGPYQVREEMTTISTMDGDRGNAHSEYVTAFAEAGWPGLITWLLVVGGILQTGLRAYRKLPPGPARVAALSVLLGVVTFLMHGLVNTFVDSVKMAALFYVSLGALVALDQRAAQESES